MAFTKDMIGSGQITQASKGTVDTLKLVGFKVMLAWHYIVLFSPVIVAKTYYLEYVTLFSRQFTLYVTLLVSFAVLMLIGGRLVKPDKAPSFALLAFAGAYGVLATIVSELVFSMPRPVRISSVVVLGSAQALLMFLWLRFYARATKGHLIRSFAVDMLFGGVLAFLICNLEEPLNYVITACLPVIATASLMLNWHDGELPDPDLSKPAVAVSKRRAAYFSLKLTIPTAAFGFTFGMMQGAFLHINVPLMIVCDPIVLGGGILLAGIVIFGTKENNGPFYVLDRLVRLSLVLFCFGVVGLILTRVNGFDDHLLLLFELLMLAGFNLIDFGSMVASFSIKRHVGDNVASVLDCGRVFVYFALAVGLLVGTVVPDLVQAPINSTLVLFCCTGLAIVLAIGMIPVRNLVRDDYALLVDSSYRKDAPPRGVCEKCLSLGTDCHPDMLGPIDSCPASGLPGGRLSDASLADSAVGEVPVSAADEAASLPQAFVSTLADLSEDPQVKSGQMSWADACELVADTYQLSRRERDVFVLIAKGRNAEFIQSELFISVHTVKTHMSHIYRKLDVHSSQELISLIEEYQQRQSK